MSTNGQVAWIAKKICNSLYLYVVSANGQGAWVAKLQLIVYMAQPLGEKPHFPTMFSTTSQLSFIVEIITFNYKIFFVIQKWCCQIISKIVDNIESTLQHSWKQRPCVICQFMLRWWHFSRHNISTIKCWLDLVDSMLTSQWMNFIHLHVMSFRGVELELWLSFNYITTNVALACVMSLRKGMEF
jgi:hypothetical protein